MAPRQPMIDPDPDSPRILASAPATGDSPRKSLDPAVVRRIVLGIMLAMFLSALDQTIVATALPAIGRELGAIEDISWVITAYLLSATAITPLYGKLSDSYGRRAVLLAGIAMFAAGSIACALAHSMNMLILGRAAQGLGGGGLIALSQTIIADIMSPKERALWQAHFGIVFAVANVSGAVLGGLFAQYLHWSLIFWINVPLALAALGFSYRALAALPQHHRRRRLDVIGAALMAAATVTLLLALTWGGTRHAWASPVIVGLVAGSFGFWVLFALRLATAAEPFLPLALLGNGVVLCATLAAFFGMGTMVGLSVYVPIYFQSVLGLSAAASGLGLIPLFGCGVIGATISGRAIVVVAHYKRIPLVGLACGAAALAILALAPAMPLLLVVTLLAVAGLATGSMFPVTTVSLQNAVHPHQLGTATATMNFFRQLGGAILVAGFGAILLGAAGIGRGRAAEAVIGAPGVADPHVAAAFGWIFAGAAAGLAAGWLFLLIMEERPLRDRPPGEAD